MQVIGEIVQIPHVTEQRVPVVDTVKIVEGLQQLFIEPAMQLIDKVPLIQFIAKSSSETTARWIMSVELVWRSTVDNVDDSLSWNLSREKQGEAIRVDNMDPQGRSGKDG